MPNAHDCAGSRRSPRDERLVTKGRGERDAPQVAPRRVARDAAPRRGRIERRRLTLGVRFGVGHSRSAGAVSDGRQRRHETWCRSLRGRRRTETLDEDGRRHRSRKACSAARASAMASAAGRPRRVPASTPSTRRRISSAHACSISSDVATSSPSPSSSERLASRAATTSARSSGASSSASARTRFVRAFSLITLLPKRVRATPAGHSSARSSAAAAPPGTGQTRSGCTRQPASWPGRGAAPEVRGTRSTRSSDDAVHVGASAPVEMGRVEVALRALETLLGMRTR